MIYFLHIPKTGGTHLRNLLGGDVWMPRGVTGERYDGPIPTEGWDVVTGHIPYRQIPGRWVTLLRDPVERTLSHYYAMLGRDRYRRGATPPIENVTPNLQTDLLADGDLDLALDRLETFHHVGFTSRFDDTVKALGLRRRKVVDRYVPWRPRGREVPAHLREQAVALNRLDSTLFKVAYDRFS